MDSKGNESSVVFSYPGEQRKIVAVVVIVDAYKTFEGLWRTLPGVATLKEGVAGEIGRGHSPLTPVHRFPISTSEMGSPKGRGYSPPTPFPFSAVYILRPLNSVTPGKVYRCYLHPMSRLTPTPLHCFVGT